MSDVEREIIEALQRIALALHEVHESGRVDEITIEMVCETVQRLSDRIAKNTDGEQ